MGKAQTITGRILIGILVPVILGAIFIVPQYVQGESKRVTDNATVIRNNSEAIRVNAHDMDLLGKNFDMHEAEQKVWQKDTTDTLTVIKEAVIRIDKRTNPD